MGVAIVGFVFPHTLQSLLEESFTDKIIQTYREDPDLQNFIDFGQQEVSRKRVVIDERQLLHHNVSERIICNDTSPPPPHYFHGAV